MPPDAFTDDGLHYWLGFCSQSQGCTSVITIAKTRDAGTISFLVLLDFRQIGEGVR
jgi:hypothetical protein